MRQGFQPIIIENQNQLSLVNSVEELDINKNAYQRSWFWEISQKSDRPSDINKGPNHIFPKSQATSNEKEHIEAYLLKHIIFKIIIWY